MADGSEITTTKARPRLGHSAQSKWQKAQQAKGNCRACGKPRPPELKQHCRACQDKINVYMKRYRASRKEKANGPDESGNAAGVPVPDSSTV